jgi:hypothetical protein
MNYQTTKPARAIGLLAITLLSTCLAYGQQKSLAAQEIIRQITAGQTVNIENAVITGELDLTALPNPINDAVYPEQGKTARVFSHEVKQSVTFSNVKFTGRFSLFRQTTTAKEIREDRVVFRQAVRFENCVFAQETDFTLANFEGEVSFANSVFQQKPLLVRIGLSRPANLDGAVFAQGSVFQFTQNDERRNLSVADLQSLMRQMGGN